MARGRLSFCVQNVFHELTDLNQESPTLDLANDCFRFVTGFFEIISTSAPHIYHSALLLSPPTSVVQRLYRPQANPLARVVQGVPTSWEPSIANKRFPSGINAATWSQCGKFIAIAINSSCEVVVLDAMTLGQLHTMPSKKQSVIWHKLLFSPDGHLLTGYSWRYDCIVSWDLQTGGPISDIDIETRCGSMSYSGSGTMLGVLSGDYTITTYNILSGTQISSHSVPESVYGTIWTCGEYIQFATVGSRSIDIWEVSFTSGHTPTQISSLPTPDNFSSNDLVLLPALSQLAFTLRERILVWDVQQHKFLLDSTDVKSPRSITFSPDGSFFLYGTSGLEFHLWKKSPDGYLPHQTLMSSDAYPNLLVSPNGESIISFSGPRLQLWHTTLSPTSSPTISTQASQSAEASLLELSPDGSLVAVTQQLGNTVTVLDLRSGNPQLVIDTGTRICGMRITESRIIVVGDGKIIAWELPARDNVHKAYWNIDNSVWTTAFELSALIGQLHASISPDLKHIAIVNITPFDSEDLSIFCMDTGRFLVAAESQGYIPGFSPDRHEVWCATDDGEVDQWTITKNDGSGATELNYLVEGEEPLSGFPWHSSCGYEVTDDGWILGPSGKQLLWLPHQWRSSKAARKWSGKFFAVGGLSEVVILELDI